MQMNTGRHQGLDEVNLKDIRCIDGFKAKSDLEQSWRY